MRKKALILALCAALALTSAALGTVAFLTDRTQITNVFTIGNVQIKLDETDVNLNGDPIPDAEGNPVRKEEGNEYHMVPGESYTKDPAVTILGGGEDTFVRMIVRITDAADVAAVKADLEATYPDDFEGGLQLSDYVGEWDAETWLFQGMTLDTANNEMVLEFRYFEVVPAAAGDQMLKPLFTSFTLPGQLNAENLELIKDMQIIVEGHAIQKATFDTADAAWDAFDAQNTAEDAAVPPVVPAP